MSPARLADVEAALLARGAVRRGRHLRVRCPAPEHDDLHPSADVDLQRGWICRSCGRGGGLRQLAELLGVTSPTTGHPPRRCADRVPVPPPGVDWQAWREVWPEILEMTRQQRRRLEPYLPIFAISDYIRTERQQIAQGRLLASAGGDTERVWQVLDLMAALERFVNAIEAELDAVARHAA